MPHKPHESDAAAKSKYTVYEAAPRQYTYSSQPLKYARSYSKKDSTPKHWVFNPNTEFGKARTHPDDEVLQNCYLSRVVYGADDPSTPKEQRTPKAKLTGFISDVSGLLSTVSQVYQLRGNPDDDAAAIFKNDLYGYLIARDGLPTDTIDGILTAVVDSVILERWDTKLLNYTKGDEGPVRLIDLGLACNKKEYREEKDSKKKEWTQKDFRALVLGRSTEKDRLPEGIVEGSTEAVAIALSQIFVECGTRTNEHPSYREYTEKTKGFFAEPIVKAITHELTHAQKGTESPSKTLLRLFKERIEALETSRIRKHNPEKGSKNPAETVKEELKEKVFLYSKTSGEEASLKKKYCEHLDILDKRLEETLHKMMGFVEGIEKELFLSEKATSFAKRPGIRRSVSVGELSQKSFLQRTSSCPNLTDYGR